MINKKQAINYARRYSKGQYWGWMTGYMVKYAQERYPAEWNRLSKGLS